MRGRGSANTDEFIREVDEAVRQDQWQKLWRKYGNYIVGAALAVVIASAAGVGWRTWQQNVRFDEARRFAAAEQMLQEEMPAEAAQAFASLAEDSNGGYGVLARLRAAQAQAEAGDRAAASAVLGRLATDDDAAPIYRSLGELLAKQQQFVLADADVPLVELESLASSDGPWRHSALELRALAQMQSGETVAARQTLDDLLADPLTPPNLARRAAELLAFLGGPPASDVGEGRAVVPDSE